MEIVHIGGGAGPAGAGCTSTTTLLRLPNYFFVLPWIGSAAGEELLEVVVFFF